MRSSVRSLLSWLGSIVVLRHGSLDISIWARITKIVSLSRPSTPWKVPTPTAAPASSPRPPSCAPAPPATADSNPASSVETRTDSRSAPSTTRRTARSASTPPSPSRGTPTRLVFTPTRTRPTSTTSTSRCTSPMPEIRYIPRMTVSRGTTRTVTSTPSTLRWILLPGGTCPAAAPWACSTETSSSTTPPPSLPSALLWEPTSLWARRLASSTRDLMLTRARCYSRRRKAWRARIAPPWPETFASRPWSCWTRTVW
mmetsp:Transcript_25610/g.40292  ORF Transcript_25610/g.40292 Transcript_25610/m.40292 type:complete len:256 (-) Transcript_25610:530-1297(-)